MVITWFIGTNHNNYLWNHFKSDPQRTVDQIVDCLAKVREARRVPIRRQETVRTRVS